MVSADSLYMIGENYLNEDTDTPKYDSAEYYLSKAVSLNYPKALYTLGYEYSLGHKLERDQKKGIEYLKKAAELGIAESHYSLASFYYHQVDIDSAVKMLENGSAAGDDVASYELYLLHFYGRAFGDTEKKNVDLINERKGLEYLFKAVEMGNFDAQLSLSYSYKRGLEGLLEPEREKALYYFEQAQKNPGVQNIPGASEKLEVARSEIAF